MIKTTAQIMGKGVMVSSHIEGKTAVIIRELISINAAIFKKLLPDIKDNNMELLVDTVKILTLREMKDATSIDITMKKEG